MVSRKWGVGGVLMAMCAAVAGSANPARGDVVFLASYGQNNSQSTVEYNPGGTGTSLSGGISKAIVLTPDNSAEFSTLLVSNQISLTNLSSWSNSVINLDGGSGISISASMGHAANIGAAADVQGVVYFQATDSTTSYNLQGGLNFSGVPSKATGGSNASMGLTLTDLTSGAAIEDVESNNTDPSGALSVPNGVYGYSGMLSENDVYELSYYASIDSGSTHAVSANGSMGLSLTDSADPGTPLDPAAATPLPSSAYAGFLLLGVLAVGRFTRVGRNAIPVQGASATA